MTKKRHRFILLLSALGLAALLLDMSLPMSFRQFFAKRHHVQYYAPDLYHNHVLHKLSRARVYIHFRQKLNQRAKVHKKLAMVLAVDQAALMDKNMKVHYWRHRRRMLSPMRAFYAYALKHGIHIFFITGRSHARRDTTIQSLKKAGYHSWSGLLMKHDKHESIKAFKTAARAKIQKLGYHIILNISTKWRDMQGGHAERSMLLPSPIYERDTLPVEALFSEGRGR